MKRAKVKPKVEKKTFDQIIKQKIYFYLKKRIKVTN